MALCTALKSNRSITTLNLGDPLRRQVRDNTILHVTGMLDVNKGIRVLGLGKNGLGDQEAEHLAKALGVTCALQHLDLYWYD